MSSKETSLFTKMVSKVGDNYLSEPWERKYYADKYSCCPPPLFIPIVSLAQVLLFILYFFDDNEVTFDGKRLSALGPVPTDSIIIFHPDKKAEIWRFFMYMFVHAGWVHLTFNLTVQVLIGLPLEMVHGSGRIAMIYLSGVIAGSLATSIFDPHTILVGASGGIYALLTAHLANVLLNYHQMQLGILRVVGVILVASADVGFAIYDRFSRDPSQPPVSFVSHVAGALSGLTIGLVVLKNFEQKLREQLVWWICVGIYLSALLFGILFNIIM